MKVYDIGLQRYRDWKSCKVVATTFFLCLLLSWNVKYWIIYYGLKYIIKSLVRVRCEEWYEYDKR